MRDDRHKYEPNTSFDWTPVPQPWYVKRPSNKPHVRNWLDRHYYQYEVTWGLYVLTPTEKLIINTLVLSFFSLIVYGLTKLTLFQYVVSQCVAILLRNGRVILKELSELLMDITVVSSSSTEAEDHVIIATSARHGIEPTAMAHSY
jgi:hypothetical protein